MNLTIWLVIPAALVGLALVGVWATTLVWVYQDAERLGKPCILVAALIGLICWPVGLLVWLILRQDYEKARQPSVSQPAEARTGQCPRCGRVLASDTAHGLCPACLLQQAAIGSDPGNSGLAGFTPPSIEELAAVFPQLEIIELLGKGGMGAVYLAKQRALERVVALKVLPAQAESDPSFGERFQREARALAQLNHPHIVNVYDFGQAQQWSYFIMEYVDGVNLRQLQRTGRLSPREALAIVPQICEALQFAHDRGIVHRDIKPENILIDKQGQVKIADFGLAKLLRVEPGGIALTETRHAVGTVHYMAPEQLERPQSVDHRADIYSLGVVFYEMLTGELPLGRFPAPSQRVQVDVRLDEVVLKALEKEPDRRYQQASEVKTRIESVSTNSVEGRPVPAGSRPAVESTPPPHSSMQQGRLILDSMAGFLAVLGVILGMFLVTERPADPTGSILSIVACFVMAISLALYGRWPKKLPAEEKPARPISPARQKASYAARITLIGVAGLMVALSVYSLGPHLHDPRYMLRLVAVVLVSAGLVFLAIVQRPRT